MFIWRVVATSTVTGKQVVSDWFDNEVEAQVVLRQMSLEPTYVDYELILERKLVS